MKRFIQILLFLVILILIYMCIISIRQGMEAENPDEMAIIELF